MVLSYDKVHAWYGKDEKVTKLEKKVQLKSPWLDYRWMKDAILTKIITVIMTTLITKWYYDLAVFHTHFYNTQWIFTWGMKMTYQCTSLSLQYTDQWDATADFQKYTSFVTHFTWICLLPQAISVGNIFTQFIYITTTTNNLCA